MSSNITGLQILNGTKKFHPGTAYETTAFKEINLSLVAGEFLIMIGTNGSGKSSILNAIAGDFILTKGSIKLDNKDISFQKKHKRSKKISRVFQNPLTGTISEMTVAENMMLAFSRKEPKRLVIELTKKRKLKFQESLSLFEMGLEEKIESTMNTLSGGQRQAISLLMAIQKKPRLLLLDEHTASLDPVASENIMDVSSKLIKKYQLTTIMITHSIDDALAYGDSLAMIKNGKLIHHRTGINKKALTKATVLSWFNTTKSIL